MEGVPTLKYVLLKNRHVGLRILTTVLKMSSTYASTCQALFLCTHPSGAKILIFVSVCPEGDYINILKLSTIYEI
jgi:hypothetical protein